MNAITPPGTTELVTVEIETKGGDVHVLPGMDLEVLQRVLPEPGVAPSSSLGSLALVNASFVVLAIPFLIVKQVRVKGNVLWASPV